MAAESASFKNLQIAFKDARKTADKEQMKFDGYLSTLDPETQAEVRNLMSKTDKHTTNFTTLEGADRPCYAMEGGMNAVCWTYS